MTKKILSILSKHHAATTKGVSAHKQAEQALREAEAELERLRAQAALHASAQRYRTLFASIDEGFCIIEKVKGEADAPLDFRYVEANVAFEVQSGVRDVVGKTIRQVFPDESEEWFLTYDTVLRTRESIRFERGLVAQKRVLELYAFPVEDEGCVAVIFKEITKRKRAEEALRTSEERFRAFVTASSDVVYRMSPDWVEMRQLYGPNFIVDTQKPNSNWLQEYIFPDDQPQVLATINEAIRTKGIFDMEHRVRRVDGSLGWTSSRAVPLLDAQGEIVEWFGTASDVSEGKKTTEALRESEERYRNLFNSIDEGFCIVEMIFDEQKKPVDYRFLEVNSSFEKQTGMHDADGKRMRELAPNHEAHWFETYGKVALTGEPVRFVNEAKALNRWFDVNAFRLGGAESRKVAILFTDITARKQSELSLNNAMAVADKANLAKSDFLSSMSHELRTPLNAILGFAQLMQAGSPPPAPSQKRSIDQILKAGWYLLELINEILDLTLIESGKLPLALEPISLPEVVRECQAMIKPQALKTDIHMSFPQFKIPYFVKADRTRVKQILINLLSNAIKYNKVGGTVVVDCIMRTPGRIRISVKDSGEGLTPDKLTQLFQPFNRLGKEIGIEGTGIGLVVSKRLVELMGGIIGAESELGVGSLFWIELSLMTPPQLAIPEGESAALVRPQVAEGFPVPVHTLLYVEDNLANLELIEQLIAGRSDLRLLCAADGNRGIELARVAHPEVILMDINLPGISGIEAMKILHADPAMAHIPVVALSANAMPGDIENGLEAGFFRYLTKPIKINEFMNTLDVALEFAEKRASSVQIKQVE